MKTSAVQLQGQTPHAGGSSAAGGKRSHVRTFEGSLKRGASCGSQALSMLVVFPRPVTPVRLRLTAWRGGWAGLEQVEKRICFQKRKRSCDMSLYLRF